MCLVLLSISSKTDIQKKIIRIDNYDIEFFVSLEKARKLSPFKTYYWFKSSEIHQSRASAGGLLLHSEYSKYYRSNQLAEKGKFNYGLKDGTWKKWNENGVIKLIESWKNGERDGIYIAYDSLGNKTNKGYYNNDVKSGNWINYVNKDTISYHRGEIKTIDPNKKDGFLRRLFKKKDSHKNIKKSNKKKKSQSKSNANKKNGFFKRLFKKKRKQKSS